MPVGEEEGKGEDLHTERFRQNRDGDLIWNISSDNKYNAIKAQTQQKTDISTILSQTEFDRLVRDRNTKYTHSNKKQIQCRLGNKKEVLICN